MFKELTLGQQTIDNITKKVFVEKRLVSVLFVGFFNLNQVLGFKFRRRLSTNFPKNIFDTLKRSCFHWKGLLLFPFVSF